MFGSTVMRIKVNKSKSGIGKLSISRVIGAAIVDSSDQDV